MIHYQSSIAIAVASRLISRRGRRCAVSRCFSSISSSSSQQQSKQDTDHRSNESSGSNNKQPFDKAIFQVGEWDPDTRSNPLYRPKYTGTPRIISADDFARRPSVSFSGDFKSLEDGMVILSWLDHKQQRDIYDLYVKLMMQSEKANDKITSHEYAVRKIAAQVRLTEERVAAVIQLQHNEEQLRQAGIELNDDMADYFDKGIAKEFAAAYKMQRGGRDVTRVPPATFVEDPVGVGGLQDTKRFVNVDDLIQINETDEYDAEHQRAKNIIEHHRFIEDADYNRIAIPLDKNAKSMINQAAQMTHPDTDPTVLQQRAIKAAAAPPYRQRTKNPRPRWKFVCQAVDSRKGSYTNNCVKNTIVEQDGIVRPATMADIRQTSWKPIRHEKEFIYHGVKQAWLNRVNRNVMDGWGYARVKPPTTLPSTTTTTAAIQQEEEENSTATTATTTAAESANTNDDESETKQ
jgi:hypothetical protein